MKDRKTLQQLETELKETQLRLEEAEETLRAIQNNEVDALVVHGPQGQQVYTLQGAEQPYRTLMETMSEGALTVANDGTVLYCNSHFSELLKMPLNRIIGESLHYLVRPGNEKTLEAMLRECGREGCRDEFFLKTAQGEEVPVSISARSLALGDVEAFCVVAADLTVQKRIQATLEKTRDLLEERVAERTAELSWANVALQAEITERKQIEEALRGSEERLALATSATRIGMFDWNLAKGSIFWTQTHEAIFGYAAGSTTTTTTTDNTVNAEHDYHRWADRVHPEDLPLVEEESRRCMHDCKPLEMEYRIVWPDGSLRWVETRGVFLYDSAGKADRMLGVVMDITDRKQAEEALRDSERLYRAIGESIDYGVWVCAPDGRNIYASESFLKMVGITQEQCSNFGWGDVLHPEDAERTIAAWKECVRAGGTWDMEHRFRGTDGQWHPVLARGVPVKNEGNEIVCWAGINLDISRIKEAEEALREARDELEIRVQERTLELNEAYEDLRKEVDERKKAEQQLVQTQKLEALGTLSGGIAHDFNNILAGIIGFTEMVIEDVTPGGPEQRRLELALKGANRGRDLVKQILAFSKQTGQARVPLTLDRVVKEGLQLLRPALPSTIEIVSKGLTTNDRILADPVQMHQILMNLCTNAAYAMREKAGILDISISKVVVTEGNPIPVPELMPGEYVVLEVRDTGSGMTPEVVERIFDPFFTTKQQGEGTGLGLSVVHGIVKSHGGAVAVESEPGKGSVFRVYLPKIEAQALPDVEEAPSETRGKEHILFVDDEELLVELNQQRLMRLGYDVVATTSSTGALDMFRKEPDRFDLVITDQTMPNLAGIDLAGELLKIRATIPIILCTGHSDALSSERAQEAGIKAFLMKPLGKRELAAAVRKVMDEKTVTPNR